MSLKLNTLLAEVAERVTTKLEKKPDVVLKDGTFDVDSLPINAPRWHRLTDVVAVFFDLKSSTNLERGRRPESTASIYDAGVGGVAKVLYKLGADFVDIQGDGGFGLFWQERRYERAMCAAITIRTFSAEFTRQLENKWPDAPTTGFKVGVASGPILAKRVGLGRQMSFQEPVWAGRPVNYAAKAAQQTDPGVILVTGSVWDEISDNDYLTFSCGCGGGEPDMVSPALLWEYRELDKIPDDQKHGQALVTQWCLRHGEEFCDAVLAGQTDRVDVQVEAKHGRNLLASGSLELLDAQKNRAQERGELQSEVREMTKRQAGVR